MVNVRVLMHEHVAKASPTAQSLGQFVWELAGFLQHMEGVAVGCRRAQSFLGDPVICQINHGFCGQV